MTAIYQGRFLYKNGKRYDFPLSHIFACPCCEYVMTSTTHEGAVTLAYTHSVTAGHAVFLEELASERADELFVEFARNVAAKVAS